MGGNSSKRKHDRLLSMPESEADVQGVSNNSSINYANAVHQVNGIPMDVFHLILSFTASSQRGGIRYTEVCGALEVLKRLVARNLACSCKMYHEFFLGTMELPELF